MFPSRFINGSKETDNAIVMRPLIHKMSESAGKRNNDYAETKIEYIHVVHYNTYGLFWGGLWYNYRWKRGRVVEGARLEIVWAG